VEPDITIEIFCVDGPRPAAARSKSPNPHSPELAVLTETLPQE